MVRLYFIGPFLLLPEIQQVQLLWQLKVHLAFRSQDAKYDVGTTKNYYITISMQKISSIHS